MSLNECENAYVELSKQIFKIRKRQPWDIVGRIADFWRGSGKFDEKVLERAIKDIIRRRLLVDDVLLKDPKTRCKVFVVAILTQLQSTLLNLFLAGSFVCGVRESNASLAILRSYDHPEEPDPLYDSMKIWEACRATSAATTFFKPITIGPHGQKFADGGFGRNNPVEKVYEEARAIWPAQIKDALLISIGTGAAPGPTLKGNLKTIINAMKKIVAQTEVTADDFARSHDEMRNRDLLFRFTVAQGMANVGLEEYKEEAKIVDETTAYLNSIDIRDKVDKCVTALKGNSVSSHSVLSADDVP
jgi:patatin-like phospholipase/acyl hydrolase